MPIVSLSVMLIVTGLLALVIIDYIVRSRRFELLYYKNNHCFSGIIVIRSKHPKLDVLLENIHKLNHTFVFVNVNNAVDPANYPDLTFVSMATEYDSTDFRNVTRILSKAYKLGYEHLKGDFLLFADSSFFLWSTKILDFMANNLVEHQVLTLRKRISNESYKDGYMLFIDFFNDLNITNDMVNYAFFAVKRETYELCESQQKVYRLSKDFEEDLFRKNISIVHVNHNENIYDDRVRKSYKKEVKRFIAEIDYIERIPGAPRLLAFLLALHVFYIMMILYFNVYFILMYALIHLLFAYALKPAMRHSVVSYMLLPVWVLWFDGIFLYAVTKRFFVKRKNNRKRLGQLKVAMLASDLQSKKNAIRLLHRFRYVEKKKHDYFEGWYIRLNDPLKKINIAVIFAVTRNRKDPHAFIQVFDANKQRNIYARYLVEEFSFEHGCIKIAENELSPNHLKVRHDNLKIDAIITEIRPLKKKSAMSFLAKLPLECFQDIIYMSASLKGVIEEDGTVIDFQGTSYMEKTYGSKFPTRWFWLQSNSFKSPLSLSISGGLMPFKFFKIFGFFAVMHYKNKEHIFATYRLSRCSHTVDGKNIVLSFRARKHELILEVELKDPVTLVGPTSRGLMTLDVEESLTSHVKLMYRVKGEIIHEDTTQRAGLEWMYTK